MDEWSDWCIHDFLHFSENPISLFSPWLVILKINSKFELIFPLETQTSSASITDTAKHRFPNIFHYPYNNSANRWQLNEEKIRAKDIFVFKYSVVRKTSYIQQFMGNTIPFLQHPTCLSHLQSRHTTTTYMSKLTAAGTKKKHQSLPSYTFV